MIPCTSTAAACACRYSQLLAEELQPRGVLVNAMCEWHWHRPTCMRWSSDEIDDGLTDTWCLLPYAGPGFVDTDMTRMSLLLFDPLRAAHKATATLHRMPLWRRRCWLVLSGVLVNQYLSGCIAGGQGTRTPEEGESFLRVHWVAAPKAMRARRANRRGHRRVAGAATSGRARPQRGDAS
jgi:hypothetical protein